MTDIGRRSGVGDMKKSVYDTNDDGKVDAVEAHATAHEDGGSDEIDATGLTGIPAGALVGDATEGRKLRRIRLYLADGTNANTINVTGYDLWNGTAIAPQDNLAKAGSETNFALDVTGTSLTVKAAAFAGNAIDLVACVVARNSTGTAINVSGYTTGGTIVFDFYNAATGAQYDLTAALDVGTINLHAAHITSE